MSPQQKKLVVGIIIVAALGTAGYFLKQYLTPASYRSQILEKMGKNKSVTRNQSIPTGEEQAKNLSHCPNIEDIAKSGTSWETTDGKWKSFSESTSTKIKSFIGAQWVGLKVGKIICLYQPEEELSFPIAMEQVHSEIVLEPTGPNWSALVTDRRLCKSINIEDCSYYLQPPPDTSDIYKGLEYTGVKKNYSDE